MKSPVPTLRSAATGSEGARESGQSTLSTGRTAGVSHGIRLRDGLDEQLDLLPLFRRRVEEVQAAAAVLAIFHAALESAGAGAAREQHPYCTVVLGARGWRSSAASPSSLMSVHTRFVAFSCGDHLQKKTEIRRRLRGARKPKGRTETEVFIAFHRNGLESRRL